MTNDAVLTVEGLSKSFGGIDAVRDVSFDVAAGELVALIGPNGAGKTTCFNLVNGQLAPDAGTVTLSGTRIDRLPPRAIARMGVGRTFQVAATFASMSVRENVQLALLVASAVPTAASARARPIACAPKPTRCSSVCECRNSRTTDVRRLPTATRSASSSRWRSPASRVCC